MMESYQSFAMLYDELMEDAPYDEWIQFAMFFIDRFAENKRTLIDLGCGTGEISLRFQEKGFQVTGVDLSAEMLAIAREKEGNHAGNITWVQQDLVKLEAPEKYDIGVSFCDVLNYIINPEDLKAAFQNISNVLTEGGLFLFDMHSEKYVNDFLANQTFGEVREDISYIWFCDEGEYDSTVEHALTFFVKTDSGQYERFDEHHIQRTYPISFIKEALSSSHFRILGIYSDFSTATFHEEGDRFFFVCQKI